MAELARYVYDNGRSTTHIMQINHISRYTVTVTSDAAVAEQWITCSNLDPLLAPDLSLGEIDLYRHERNRRKNGLHVGVGIHWEQGTREASTLSMCVDKRVLVFQLERAAAVPDNMRDLLDGDFEGRYVEFVGFLPSSVIRMFLWASRHRLAFTTTIWNLKELIFPHLFYWPFQNQAHIPLEMIIGHDTGIIGHSLVHT